MKLNKLLKMNDETNRRRESVKIIGLLAAFLFFSSFAFGQSDDDEDYISPVRPTVSDSATIQKKGVLQIEYGGDFDFDAPDYRNRQSAPLGIYFAADTKLRLDLEIETVVSQRDFTGIRDTGIGDIQLGFKAIVRDKPKERLAVAFAYSIKLPVADEEKGLGTGKFDHNLRLILNRTFGKTDYVFNVSYLNVGREMSDRRGSGTQAVFTVERELSKKFGIFGEVFGNTVDENQPRGIYLNSGLTYKISKRLVFDIGARPGLGRAAPRIGVFGGLSVGVANLLKRK